MDKLQIVFFFFNGFLVSRLIIACGAPERIVSYVIGRKHIGMTKLTLYLLLVSAALSLFVPNVITVLTLLPILELLKQAFEENGNKHPVVPTLLALSVIYGANIGGMGVITGTPANGILVAFAQAHQIQGIESVQYATWLEWGVPLVLCLVFIAWLVILCTLRPWRVRETIFFKPSNDRISSVRRRWALFFTVTYFISSIILSALMLLHDERVTDVLIVSGVFTLVFALTLFFIPLAPRLEPGKKAPLLMIRDCYSNLPVRGFLFVGAAVVLAATLYLLGLDKTVSGWLVNITPGHMGIFFFLLTTALITSFSTELLSNTAAQIGLFALITPMAESLGFPVLKTIIVVTLSCTCAFMSPIATGVNGLAFGGLRGVSLWRMLMAGLVMNSLAAVVIAFWVEFITPW